MTRLAVLLAALAAGLLFAGEALACSCAPLDARDALARSDGAFVGTLTERTVEGKEATHTFEVETAVKGESFGPSVIVRSHRDGATCGLEIPVGERIVLVLTRDGTQWRASLCDQVFPDELLAAAQPLPAPTSEGPAALLVGGSFGEARTVALDDGRVVAYGEGDGDTIGLSVCPGGGVAVELVAAPGEESVGYRLDVRELGTMDVVATLAAVDWRNGYPASIRCLSRDGLAAAVLVASSEVGSERLLAVGPSSSRLLWRGQATEGTIGQRRAYLCGGKNGRTAVAVSLGSGAARAIARLPRFTGPLTASPGGRYLAGFAVDWSDFTDPQPSRVVLVDAQTGAVRTAPLGGPYVTAKTLWLRHDRLVVVPGGGGLDRVRVFDLSLRERGEGEVLFAHDAVLLYGRLIGLVAPFIVAAPSPTGRLEELARLPSPVAYVLEAITAGPGTANRPHPPAR